MCPRLQLLSAQTICAMERLAATAPAWRSLPAGLRASLEAAGAADPVVFRDLFDPSTEGIREALVDFGHGEADDAVVAAFGQLHAAVVPVAERAHERHGAASGPAMAVAVGVAERTAKRLRLAAATEEVSARLPRDPPPPGAAPAMRFPTQLRRSAALAGDPAGRRRAEDAERRRWLERLGGLVVEAGLPLAEVARSVPQPQVILDRVGQGRRATTLRRRCRDWEKARRFLVLQLGRAWPRDVGDLLLYIDAMVEGGYAPSAFVGFVSALAFLERGGGVVASGLLHSHGLLTAAIQESRLQASRAAPRAVRGAPRLPLAVIAGLERLVVKDGPPTYVRMYAWIRLIKVWGTLRFDDHRGLEPRNVALTEAGLVGTLTRTKTSGLGKKREVLGLFIDSAVHISEPAWLSCGWGLWAATDQARDYFIGLPTGDLSGMLAREARYTDGLAMGRATLCHVVGPGDEAGLIDERFVGFWSEHSERATLPSLVGTMECFPREWVELLGRWEGKQADDYIRTQRVRIGKMQRAVGEKVRAAADQEAVFDESDVFIALAGYAADRGIAKDDVDAQVSRLRFRGVPRATVPEEAAPATPLEASAAGPLPDGPLAGADAARPEGAPLHAVADGPHELVAGTYVVSIRARTKRRVLHRIGGCYRIAGIDYFDYEVLGDLLPAPTKYHDVCKGCFSSGLQRAPPAGSSSSGSSSTDEP